MIDYVEKYRFEKAEVGEVVEFLKSRELQFIETTADSLKFIQEGDVITIFDKNTKKAYPASRLLVEKLLYWNKNLDRKIQQFKQLNFFPLDVKVHICNSNLEQMGNKKLVLRIENGVALIVSSDKYTFFSDLDVIELAKPFDIKSVSRDGKILRIDTEIRSEYAPVENDVSGFGFTIINSETGYAAVDIQLFVLRYWCKNGATTVAHEARRKVKHYKTTVEKLFSSTKEMLTGSEIYRKQYEEKLKESLQVSAESFFPEIIGEIKYLLGDLNEAAFFKDFPIKWNTTKYDLYNYITDKAKKYGVYERYKLEAFAGNLIMTKNGKKIRGSETNNLENENNGGEINYDKLSDEVLSFLYNDSSKINW